MQHVVHRRFAQVMVDAKDVGLVEVTVQDAVKLARRREVVAERLFDDDARARRASYPRQLLDNRLEQAWRNGRGSAPRRVR